MPLVEAAANVNTYSENLDPYNTFWQMGKNIYFAQTFPLAEGSRLFRTCFQVCCHVPYDPWQYSIRLTDGAGKPLSVDLYMKERTSTNSPICEAARPGWQCMDWNFEYYPAGTYALVLARPGSPDNQRAHMYGITPAATTAAHKTWRSLDYGITWTEIANTELSHAVYGYKPPPNPPPPAAIGNWFITNIVQTLTPTGYQIVVTTNVPAHLFLRWTLAPPGQHIKEVMERGAPVQKIIDQCFVATNDANQTEDGDTLTHTFLLEPWPVCETRWFYFWGTRVMYRQPSVSPIYEKHRVALSIITPCYNTPLLQTSSSSFGTCNAWSYAIKPCVTFTPTIISFWLQKLPANPQTPTARAQIFTAPTGTKPDTLIAQSALITLPPLPLTPTKCDFPLISPQLLQGTNYAIVFFTDGPRPPSPPYPAIKMTRTTNPDSCPNAAAPNSRMWFRTCTSGPVTCNCTGRAWVWASGQPLQYSITGTP